MQNLLTSSPVVSLETSIVDTVVFHETKLVDVVSHEPRLVDETRLSDDNTSVNAYQIL